MAYGLSNGQLTDDDTWPPKVLWGSTVGYPSDNFLLFIFLADGWRCRLSLTVIMTSHDRPSGRLVWCVVGFSVTQVVRSITWAVSYNTSAIADTLHTNIVWTLRVINVKNLPV